MPLRPPPPRVPRGAASLLLAAAAGAAGGAEPPAPFAAHYEGRHTVLLLPATVQARIELRRSATHLRYTMTSTVRWAMVERRFRDCSVMRIDGGRLAPLEYRHVDEHDPDKDVHTRFDAAAGRATTQRGRKPEPLVADLAGPAWDPMSFQVALMALAPQRPPGAAEPMRVVERGVVKEHEVRFGAPQALPAGGSVVEVTSRKASGGRVALRLDAQRGHQPLRIVVDELVVDRVGSPEPPPAALPDGSVPDCAAPAR